VRLLGHRLALVTEAHDAVRDGDDNDQKHDAGDVEDRPLQVVDALSILARRAPRVLRRVLGATAEDDQGSQGAE
jgi:hypothetical protein